MKSTYTLESPSTPKPAFLNLNRQTPHWPARQKADFIEIHLLSGHPGTPKRDFDLLILPSSKKQE